MHALDMDYCISTFDTDPFEPQPDGAKTIFPYWVQSSTSNHGFVELPYTLPQDFTLFILLGEKTIDIWRQKLDWLAAHGGMALLNTHPDYMDFSGNGMSGRNYSVRHFIKLLLFVQHQYTGLYYHALPKEIATAFRRALSDREKRLSEIRQNQPGNFTGGFGQFKSVP
jgi:hypothetical protein